MVEGLALRHYEFEHGIQIRKDISRRNPNCTKALIGQPDIPRLIMRWLGPHVVSFSVDLDR